MFLLRPPSKRRKKSHVAFTRKQRPDSCGINTHWSAASCSSSSENHSRHKDTKNLFYEKQHVGGKKDEISTPVKKMVQYELYNYIN